MEMVLFKVYGLSMGERWFYKRIRVLSLEDGGIDIGD